MLFYFSLATVVATWILLLIGGIVNPMGASLACPDWYFIPTCNGELLPEMVGGVLYEHGHRLWASAVGLMTLMQCIWIFAKGSSLKRLRKAAVFSVVLVALQGTFGGVTVLLGLNAILSSMHLLTAMVFFCLLIYLAWNLAAKTQTSASTTLPDATLQIAFAMVLLQILLGGVVRHLGAGMACGDDWVTCGPELWPSWHLGQLHMIHRFMGYCVGGVLLLSTIKAFKSSAAHGDRTGMLMALLPTVLVLVQIVLGLLTVATIRSVPIVVAHTAVGALLLASQFALVLRELPQGEISRQQPVKA